MNEIEATYHTPLYSLTHNYFFRRGVTNAHLWDKCEGHDDEIWYNIWLGHTWSALRSTTVVRRGTKLNLSLRSDPNHPTRVGPAGFRRPYHERHLPFALCTFSSIGILRRGDREENTLRLVYTVYLHYFLPFVFSHIFP